MLKNGRKLRILMFPSDKYGCGYYRMLLPGKKLRELGHTVDFMWKFDQIPANYHIYHFQRVTTPAGLAAIRSLRRAGKIVMMDMDDDLFNLYPGHPSAWYFKKGKECMDCHNITLPKDAKVCNACGSKNLQFQDRLKSCTDSFQYLNVLTVSTPELKERYGKAVSRCEIVPNYIDIDIYDKIPKKDEKYIAVGWAGSFTHTLDLSMIGGALGILNNYDNTYFFTAGESGENIKKLFEHVFKDESRLVIIPPVETEEYPHLVHNFDIGLAPIEDNAFNRAKSELKAIEYGAAHIPVIASDVAPYRRYVEDGVTGFLVRKNKDWRKYTKLLIEDEELRHKMGEANYQKARTMDINKQIVEREALYQELVEKNFVAPAGGVMYGRMFG